jgi:MFS family permease
VSRRSTVDGWYTLLAATFAIGVSNSVVFSVLSDLQDKYGFSDAGLGWIAGSGFIVGFFAQLLIAPYADRGHSKRLLIGGLLLAVVGGVVFAGSSSIVMFIVARGVLGLSNGVFIPAARAIVAGMSDEGVAERLGRLGGIELAGFVTGPIIGGALVGPLGLRWPFLVCSTAAAAAAVMLVGRHLPEPRRSDRPERLPLGMLRLREMRVALLLAIGLFIPIGVFDALWDRYMTDRGASNITIGLSFLMYGIPFALLAPRGGRLADRVGAVRVCVVTMTIAALSTASYGLITVPWVILGVLVFEGIVQAIAVPAAQAAVAAAATVGRSGAAQGLAGSGQLLAAAMASFASPAIYSAFGAGPVFAIAGGIMMMFALIAKAMSAMSPRSAKSATSPGTKPITTESTEPVLS